MAAGDIVVPRSFKLKQMLGTLPVNFGTATMEIRLATALPAEATIDFRDDFTEIATATAYTGAIPVTVTCTDEAGTVRVKVSSGDIVIAQDAGGFANALSWVLYQNVGTAATDPVVCFGDFGSAKGNVTGSLTIDFENTNGSTVFEY